MRIDQVLPGVSSGDAVTSMALELREHLRKFCDSDIYAEFILSEDLRSEVAFLAEQAPDRCVDATIFHVSYGRPAVTAHLLRRSEPIIISFHNFSPAERFLTYNPEFAVGLEWGEYDLVRFKNRVVATFADSEFNAETLLSLGYEDIAVAPLGLRADRLKNETLCPETAAWCEATFPNGFVLCVSQLLPHKRVEQVVEVSHLLGAVHRRTIPICIVGSSREALYSAAVQTFSEVLPNTNIHFLGSVTDARLGTLMRRAKIFLGVSDHEGLCIPPLEAMSMGVPVIIKGAAAVPETVQDAALVLPVDSGPGLIAEAVVRLWDSQILRDELILRGLQRVDRLDPSAAVAKAIQIIQAAIA
jgi:L-malate glycosyltransferase